MSSQRNTELATISHSANNPLPTPRWWIDLFPRLTNEKNVYSFFFLMGACLVLTYLFFPVSANSIPLLFIKELGFALIIAAMLGFTIEWFNVIRHEHRENSLSSLLSDQSRNIIDAVAVSQVIAIENIGFKISKGVFEAIHGTSIPKEVLDALTRFVLAATRVRFDFQIKIWITKLDEYLMAKGHVYDNADEREADAKKVAFIYYSYWLDKNVSAHTIDMSLPFEIFKEGPRMGGITGFNFFKVSHQINGTQKTVRCESMEDLRASNMNVKEIERKFSFEYNAECVPAGGSVEVEFKYILIQDIEDDHIIMSLPPCVGIDLMVSHSESISLTVSSVHSEPEIELERSPGWPDGERRWQLQSALMPCQGFVIMWGPHKPAAAAHPAA